MTTWTATAQRELEDHLAGLRLSLAGSGADPDEVLDDVRRHVAEEATAARLPVVTEADVRRFLQRVAPLAHPGLPPAAGGAPAETPIPPRTAPPDSPQPIRARSLSWGRRARILLFGVLVPVATLIFEAMTRSCAGEIFDPLPTFWHGMLVGLVPVANAIGLVPVASLGERGRRVRWWLNNAAIGISAAYSIPFMPLLPFAVLAVVFGVGLLPLAPILGLICALSLRWHMSRHEGDVPRRLRRQGWVALFAPVVFLAGFLVPGMLTRHYAGLAIHGETARSNAAVTWLREWGNQKVLLQECYGYRSGLWDGVLPSHLPQELAQQLFFRVTGQPFNAVPPPATAWSRRNRGWVNELESGGVEWDSALGSEAVAGRVRGLSLVSSRLDGMADADAAWSYVEWTMEFRNDHEWTPREARAQIQLPPGGVVSRLTLWVNGEEREAAFAGRGQVREAYQQVAVVKQRDPVLVTTAGPDRVLMQCFPVPPRGGTMKVRLGITAPLALNGDQEAVMAWPSFLERNFGQDRALNHGVWLNAPQEVAGSIEGLSTIRDDQGRTGHHGQWTDAVLGNPGRATVFKRNAASTEHRAPDRHDPKGGHVRQRVVPAAVSPIRRIAMVIDGSAGMDGHLGEVADALQRVPAGAEIGVFVVRDGVIQLPGDGRAPEVLAALRAVRCEGGQDSVSGLETAWDWAAEAAGSALVWVHGSNPVLLKSVESLRQRFERQHGASAPRLWDLPVRHGPNRILEKLDGLDAVASVPRLGSLGSDLDRWFRILDGREARWDFVREHVEGNPPGGSVEPLASTHVTRLWALAEVKRLGQGRNAAAATALAARHHLVTPYSGAVVLETKAQYEQAGLQPVDPTTVPVVPEPGVGGLLVVGLLVLGLRRGTLRRPRPQ